MISEYRWQHLTEQQQKWISEAADQAAAQAMVKMSEIENKTMDALKAANVNFYSVDNFGPWQQAVKNVVLPRIGDDDMLDLYISLLGMFDDEEMVPQ